MHLQVYASPQHAPFHWRTHQPTSTAADTSGAPARIDAALLIHGFPGTPAEMRPLAESLYQRGVTVHAPLLPGFGPEIPTIARYRWRDWLDTVTTAVDRLQSDHAHIALIGNSMGASLALLAARERNVTALVLVAPFWRVHQRLVDWVFPLVRPLLKRMRPFRKADFQDSRFRASLRNILGDEINLDDPAVVAYVRELPLPIDALAQVRDLGRAAYRAASLVDCPVLILQGRHDPVAHPQQSLALAGRLPRLMSLHMLPGDHDLVRDDSAAREQFFAVVGDFLTHHAVTPRDMQRQPVLYGQHHSSPVNQATMSLEFGNRP